MFFDDHPICDAVWPYKHSSRKPEKECQTGINMKHDTEHGLYI